MRNGTQEELDAAREDARLIPYDVVFVVINNDNSAEFDIGQKIYRRKDVVAHADDAGSVAFWDIENNDYWWMGVERIGVAS